MLNERGVQEFLSIWWIFMVVIVVGAVVIAVSIYYSAELDVREHESKILADLILNCFSNNGFLNEEVIQEDFDIFIECGLDRETFEMGDNFYFSASILDENGASLIEDISAGDESFAVECSILRDNEELEAENFPFCFLTSAEVKYFDDNAISDVEVMVITASNQRGGRVPIV